jgi:hypothetical protein
MGGISLTAADQREGPNDTVGQKDRLLRNLTPPAMHESSRMIEAERTAEPTLSTGRTKSAGKNRRLDQIQETHFPAQRFASEL